MLLLICLSCDNENSIDDILDSCPGISPQRNNDKVTISQGLWGDVWFWEGDFMPMISPSCASGTITAVVREIYIHELTTFDDVDEESPTFYSSINTPLIAVAQSDTDGFFEVELSPGSYSVFAKEGDLYYANGFGHYGEIYPIEVVLNNLTEIRFDITYLSSW